MVDYYPHRKKPNKGASMTYRFVAITVLVVVVLAGCKPRTDSEKLSAVNKDKELKDPATRTTDGITKVEGQIGSLIDLGKETKFKLSVSSHVPQVFVAGVMLDSRKFLTDRDISLFFANGICWRTDTTYAHIRRNNDMYLYFIHVDKQDADLEYCKKALRYEMSAPYLGAKIDPDVLYKCQLKGEGCPDNMPDEQFECDTETKKFCSTTTPDGLCCRAHEYVSYSREFSKKLRDHRKKHCDKMQCLPTADSLGYPNALCLDGKCVLNNDSWVETLHGIEL